MTASSPTDPGIRRLVRWLHSHGYETTCSGDGLHPRAEDDGLDMPHVFIACLPETMYARARALVADLASIGIVVTAMADDVDGPVLQGTYDPVDGTAELMLLGVSDADMPPPAN